MARDLCRGRQGDVPAGTREIPSELARRSLSRPLRRPAYVPSRRNRVAPFVRAARPAGTRSFCTAVFDLMVLMCASFLQLLKKIILIRSIDS